jgi:hypothetical protein
MWLSVPFDCLAGLVDTVSREEMGIHHLLCCFKILLIIEGKRDKRNERMISYKKK